MTTATTTTTRVDSLIKDLETRLVYLHREGFDRNYRKTRHWMRAHHAYDRLVDSIGQEEALIHWHGILAYYRFPDFEPRDTERIGNHRGAPTHRYIPHTFYELTDEQRLEWGDPFQGDWIDNQDDDYDGTDVLAIMEEIESFPTSDVPNGIPTQQEINAQFDAWSKADPFRRGKRPLTRLEHIGAAYYRWFKDEVHPSPHMKDEREYLAEIGATVTQAPIVTDHYRDKLDTVQNARLKELHELLYDPQMWETHPLSEYTPSTKRGPEVSLDEVGENPAPPRGSLTLRDSDGFTIHRSATLGIDTNTTVGILKQAAPEVFYAYIRARHETTRLKKMEIKEILHTDEPTVDTRIRTLVLAYWHDFHHQTEYYAKVVSLYRVHNLPGWEQCCELAMEAVMQEPSTLDETIARTFEKEIRFMKSNRTGIYFQPQQRVA